MTDDLFGVTELSPGNVWAVGNYSGLDGRFRTLIEHWNGKTWEQVSSPDPGIGDEYLSSVSAISPTNIWAVGDYSNQSGGIAANKTLILHWNGSSWRQIASPSPGSFIDDLNSVHSISASNAWAVGLYSGSDFVDENLILHWNGRDWSQVAGPDPGKQSNVLNGVDGTASNLWAVGVDVTGDSNRGSVLHWDGHKWSTVASPNPAGHSDLMGVSATSATNAWAVGDDGKGLSMTLHWNGRAWSRVSSPNILPAGDDNLLQSVKATSATNAWAVGAANILSTGTAFELYWNGRKWTNMPSPNPGANSSMDSVAATSASDAFTVGEYGLNPSATTQRALAFRCRG